MILLLPIVKTIIYIYIYIILYIYIIYIIYILYIYIYYIYLLSFHILLPCSLHVRPRLSHMYTLGIHTFSCWSKSLAESVSPSFLLGMGGCICSSDTHDSWHHCWCIVLKDDCTGPALFDLYSYSFVWCCFASVLLGFSLPWWRNARYWSFFRSPNKPHRV